MGKRLWLLALALGFAVGTYLVVVNRHAAQLREDARVAAQWKPSQDRRNAPSPAELAKLSARAQQVIHAQCYNEGGNPFANRNCYAEAASFMLYEAREQDAKRDMAYLGLGVVAGLTALTLVATRKKPAFEP
ncbi:MAG TPA: hypothetical protein VHP33_36985 [Polyangiaceae bacterium]|nr:hypothetical protein [Polyangiaceae bacterium]